MSYNILFIHQHFPGQFKHIGPALAKDNNVHSLSMFDYSVEGVQNHKWAPRRGNGDNVHPLALEFETKVLPTMPISAKVLMEKYHISE